MKKEHFLLEQRNSSDACQETQTHNPLPLYPTCRFVFLITINYASILAGHRNEKGCIENSSYYVIGRSRVKISAWIPASLAAVIFPQFFQKNAAILS
jgi:hypothetical protein